MTIERLRRLALSAVALAGAAGPAAAQPAPDSRETRIAVLVSQEAPPYRQALAGFTRALERRGLKVSVRVGSLEGDGAKAAQALAAARPEQAQLILTLGTLATQAVAARKDLTAPVVTGLVLRVSDLGGANATGVVLEFPVETELRWLQRFFPGRRAVGVLYHPDENRSRIEAAVRTAQALGLTLVARSVERARDLPDELESLANRADLLWGVADSVVLTPQTAKPILLFSYRNRIPFVGLSQSWVKAGALYALDRDYDDIGAQCAELAFKVLRGTPPSALPPEPPRKLVYSINLRTARHMKLEIPDALLKGAQEVVD